MIIGIGIDTIEIDRFKQWHEKPINQLSRIFTPLEITYCLSTHAKTAERFAVRFAAKEAFYKAFSSHFTQKTSFLSICNFIEVMNNKKHLSINWKKISSPIPANELIVHLSMTHSTLNASAVVIIEQSKNSDLRENSYSHIDKPSKSSSL